MTDVIVEVGPEYVRGPNDARPEWISAGLECIDDDIVLVDDRPVSVTEVWQKVLGTTVGHSVETVVLVCPSWWSPSRIDVVCDAAGAFAMGVVVLRRSEVLREGLADRLATVVEIAHEFVVITQPGRDVAVVTRRGDAPAVAEEVAGRVGASTAALLDAPAGVDGAALIAASVADRLRVNGVAVSIADEGWVQRGAAALLALQQGQGLDPDVPVPIHRHRRGLAVLAGAALCAAALCGGFAARGDASEPPRAGMPVTLLVEGRVGVKVPVQWTVQRITSGPGSARVQVVSPSDVDVVVHITQSSIPSHQTLPMLADTLRTALAEEPEGVFVDFNPADRRADKPAVTYRENRADRQVAWTVLVDDDVRIAIGCQTAPRREELVRDACDQAIQSAHAVF
jgi:type VII secretion-associated protein (TIGR03931 family)